MEGIIYRRDGRVEANGEHVGTWERAKHSRRYTFRASDGWVATRCTLKELDSSCADAWIRGRTNP
jgi:hypothetical protein